MQLNKQIQTQKQSKDSIRPISLKNCFSGRQLNVKQTNSPDPQKHVNRKLNQTVARNIPNSLDARPRTLPTGLEGWVEDEKPGYPAPNPC